MQIKGIEFGLIRDHRGRLCFQRTCVDVCETGCRIYSFACFYFTILAPACRALTEPSFVSRAAQWSSYFNTKTPTLPVIDINKTPAKLPQVKKRKNRVKKSQKAFRKGKNVK